MISSLLDSSRQYEMFRYVLQLSKTSTDYDFTSDAMITYALIAPPCFNDQKTGSLPDDVFLLSFCHTAFLQNQSASQNKLSNVLSYFHWLCCRCIFTAPCHQIRETTFSDWSRWNNGWTQCWSNLSYSFWIKIWCRVINWPIYWNQHPAKLNIPLVDALLSGSYLNIS